MSNNPTCCQTQANIFGPGLSNWQPLSLSTIRYGLHLGFHFGLKLSLGCESKNKMTDRKRLKNNRDLEAIRLI